MDKTSTSADAIDSRSLHDKWRDETAGLRSRLAEEKAARDAAGMGLWRLIFIVAAGILAADIVRAAASWFIGSFLATTAR